MLDLGIVSAAYFAGIDFPAIVLKHHLGEILDPLIIRLKFMHGTL